jgi:hypothetical protein
VMGDRVIGDEPSFSLSPYHHERSEYSPHHPP